jgi:hypothetical protein
LVAVIFFFAWQQFRPFSVRKSEFIRYRATQGRERPVPAVGGATQEREEDFVELGDGHWGGMKGEV